MARDPDSKPGMSKTKLLVGAGALFLFIVGVRKTWQRPDELGPLPDSDRERQRDRDREQREGRD